MFIQISVVQTSKNIGSKEEFEGFSTFTKDFETLKDAKKWVKEHYGKCKKMKIYQDREGAAVHCGYIYCFNNADYSHYPVQHWKQRDWVSYSTVRIDPIDIS